MTDFYDIIHNLSKSNGEELSFNTKKNYVVKFKKAIHLGIDPNSSEKDLIHQFEVLRKTESLNNINDYLNVIYLVKREMKHNVELLKTYKSKLLSDSISSSLDRKEDITEKDLKEHTKNLFKIKEYRKYIINYLILTVFGIKNNDFLIRLSEKIQPENYNYLILGRDNISLIRKGRETVTINSKSFYEAVKSLLGQNLIINESDLFKEVKQSTYKGIGLTRCQKIIMNKNYEPINLEPVKEINQSKVDLSETF